MDIKHLKDELVQLDIKALSEKDMKDIVNALKNSNTKSYRSMLTRV